MGVESQLLALGKGKQDWRTMIWSDGGRDLGLITGQVSAALLDSICLFLTGGGWEASQGWA